MCLRALRAFAHACIVKENVYGAAGAGDNLSDGNLHSSDLSK